MPRFAPEPTSSTNPSAFSFSAVDLNTLTAAEYTLVGITGDRSGSTSMFYREQENAIKEVIRSCQKSPRADNLMVRCTSFDHNLTEVHGFRLLQDCKPDDYSGILTPGGSTALYDAAIDAVDALARYGKELQNNDYTANAILFVLTDGDDNGSKFTAAGVKAAVERARLSENLESIVTILIGVNVTNPAIASYLKRFQTEAGFTQYVELKDASAATLAKLAAFVSRSISSASQALGSGGVSQPVSF